MIYRKLDANGDYVFGKGAGNFLSNSPATVAQAIQTALRLFQGEYFPNVLAGVPFGSKILGAGTKTSYDLALQSAILGVTGVLQITQWTSSVDANRKATVNCVVDTVYGQAQIAITQKAFSYNPGLLDTTFVLDSSVIY
jgi:phage tail protein X